MTVVAVELEDSVAVDLKQLAESLQADEADVIRRAVKNYLRAWQMDRIRAETRPRFEAAGLCSEEDIYAEVS